MSAKREMKFQSLIFNKKKKTVFKTVNNVLIGAVQNKFNLNISFSLYEDVQGDKFDIDDMDDMKSAFKQDDDTNQTNNVLDLYYQFGII